MPVIGLDLIFRLHQFQFQPCLFQLQFMHRMDLADRTPLNFICLHLLPPIKYLRSVTPMDQ
jgi:hypothetical protein